MKEGHKITEQTRKVARSMDPKPFGSVKYSFGGGGKINRTVRRGSVAVLKPKTLPIRGLLFHLGPLFLV
jgi:hypothetical protein